MISDTGPRIQNLPSHVVDQIAAGEVIERPAQLVKELVENSIDAGATKISVDFSDAGRFVRVVDNGQGIHPEDLKKALDRFATSKIHSSEDLWRLKSFGFRGEALSSISSVAKLTLTSRKATSSVAYRMVSEFGKTLEVPEAVGGDVGTQVLVERLFENVPARLKFLKSAAAEHGQIKMVLKALALSNFQIEFRVISEGELVFLWPHANSRLMRAKQVLEIENLFEGKASRESVTAYSVFADPSTVAKTSKNMWFFAQGRWVQDRGLQAGVTEAYRHLLMHGEYPISVTWVETEPDQIDVNIHPTKAQVKFLEPSLAFRAVQASVRETLETSPWLKKSGEIDRPVVTQAVKNLSFHSPEISSTQYRQKISIEALRELKQSSVEINKSQTVDPAEEVTESTNKFWSEKQVLAQAHLTYILTQSRDSLLIIDQHAAHERVLFEKLMKAYKNGGIDIQDFLFPLAIDLSAEAQEALLKEASQFERLGLFFEALGPTTLGIRSAPAFVKESSLPAILAKTAEEIMHWGGSYSFEKSVGDLIATMACHSAIRAGQALSLEEMQALLNEMDEYPLSSFCPHGRPVSIDYPLVQIERDFGRIV